MALGWGIGLGVVGSVGSSLFGASSRNKAARKAAQNQQRQLDAQHEAQQVAYQNQVFSTTYGNKLREIQANDYNERIVAGYKQRIEEVKASLHEALKMQQKGMGHEEIIKIFKKKPTKHASGGLAGMLGE